MSEALQMADELDRLCDPYDSAIAAELRRLHAELERKSNAIQRLWKERDELRSECRTLVRQNGEWQELTAELVEALRKAVKLNSFREFNDHIPAMKAALAKVEASK